MKRFSAKLLATAALASLLGGTPAWSDTLTQALIKAYQSSPTLELNRAALRTLDENVVQAAAGRKANVRATASANATAGDGDDFDEISEVYQAAINADLLLIDGGATNAAIASANSAVDAARSALDAAEQDVLLQAITAFVDVRRDERFVSLARNNVKVIDQQVTAARDRFDVGEVTRTDVSQAEARLASARSNLATNRGGLERSKQTYILAVGEAPGKLSSPPRLPKLPASLRAAEEIAVRSHPTIREAHANLEGAEFDLERARAGRRPTLSLEGGLALTDTSRNTNNDDLTASIGLNGGVPLYQGGTLSSIERASMTVVERRRAELQNSARIVRQNVAIAWANLGVARSSIAASREEIRAARLAFEGVQEEAKLGARTTLDTLDAEQDVLNAESGLASAQRDEYIAAYTLISAMGLLNTEYLGLGIDRYDPDVNYRKVNQKARISPQSEAINRLQDRW